ncbi:hypothetical protein [Anaeromicrobium sediminis]|uniref:Uncharacterized protein n=1 Tax=Anaeromicrobium sediminis TaxID=1478221 RepID=A0A267MJF7_9FIRM|nr:hypothetical protein [Anaeromicrobium sediminis]PAB59005.1 hypothetical protein CCE28_12545 [Anaeromicrobium sediminis]
MHPNDSLNKECVNVILTRLNEGITLRKLYFELRKNRLYSNSLGSLKSQISKNFKRTRDGDIIKWTYTTTRTSPNLKGLLEKATLEINQIQKSDVNEEEKEVVIENIDELLEKLVRFRNSLE